MNAASRLQNVIKLREAVNQRNAELKEIGAQIKALLEETHNVIKVFSSELGSDFGMDEVKPPPRLEEIMPTAIPADSAELKMIIRTIRLQILYDTGMELDRLRLPLRRMDLAFDRLDLAQYLEPVEGEESLKDILEDAAFGTFLISVVRKISEHAEAISDQRSIFRRALEKASNSSQERRAGMDQEVLGALPYAQRSHITGDMEGWFESVMCIAAPGQELHDEHFRMGIFRRVRGFLLPTVAKLAFDIFERLNDCAEYARPKR